MSLAFDLNGRDGSLLRSSPTLCLRNSWLLMSHYAYNFIGTSDVLDPAQEIPPEFRLILLSTAKTLWRPPPRGAVIREATDSCFPFSPPALGVPYPSIFDRFERTMERHAMQLHPAVPAYCTLRLHSATDPRNHR